jgi:NAD(P)-dependent dehydrogenase (short-subunit alcohol dehydrogenase family)
MTSSGERTALVTGTSSGIGLHTAVGLAQAGLRVVATVRDPARADALRAAATAAGVDVDVVALEVTDAGQAERCVQNVLDRHGRLDVLVNNAGRVSSARWNGSTTPPCSGSWTSTTWRSPA